MRGWREAATAFVGGVDIVTVPAILQHLEQRSGLIGYPPTRTAIGRLLTQLGWQATRETNGRRVYRRSPARTTTNAAQPLNTLRTLGIRLETAVATVTGSAERGDATGIDVAFENRSLARDAFRSELESRCGIPVSLIERWLAL